MGVSEILAALDHEIVQLQQARTLLGGPSTSAPKRMPGRPKKNAVAVVPFAKSAGKKRNISPEGRRRMIEAQKKRWAAQWKAESGE